MRSRPVSPSTVGIGVVLAVLVAITLGSSLVGVHVFHGGDSVERFPPWNALPPDFQPDNPLVGDTVDVAMPNRRVFVERLRDGDLPLWQPYANGGRPLAAIPDQGLASPLNWPYLVLPLRYAPGVVKLLELLVAIAGTAAFVRGLGVRGAPALLAGVAFGFSGFQVVYTNYPMSQIGALVPVALWVTDRYVRSGRLGWLAGLAAVVANAWLLGFPQLTLYLLLAAGAWALVRGSLLDRRRLTLRTGALLGAVLIGTAIAAFQLLPWALDLQQFDLAYRADQRLDSLRLASLLTIVGPNALGTSTPPWTWYGSFNFIEVQSFVGVTVVLCAALGAGARRRPDEPRAVRWLLLGLVALPLLLTWWDGPLLRAFQSLPLLGLSQVHRIRVLAALALAVLAAIGVDRLLDGRPLARREFLGAGGALTALAVPLGAAAIDAADLAAGVESSTDILREELLVVAAVGLIVAAALAIAVRTPRTAQAVSVVLAVALAIEIARLALPFWPRVEPDRFYPVTPAHDVAIAEIGQDRLASGELTLYPGTTTWYGIRSVASHAFALPSWRAALERVDAGAYERESPTFPRLLATEEVATSPVLDRLSARVFAAPQDALFGVPDSPRAGDQRVTVGTTPIAAGVPDATTRLRGGVVDATGGGEGVTDLYVELLDATGAVVVRGQRRFVFPVLPAQLTVGLPDVDPATVASLRLRADGAPLELRADAAGPVVGVVEPRDDELTLVHSGGALLYRRNDALPRIRWATAAVTETDEDRRLDLLASGSLPDDTVVLHEPGSPIASGGTATLAVLDDAGDTIRVRIEAAGPGLLVVADSLQTGWRAEVDGTPVDLRDADQVGVAVPVPGGTHEVTLAYQPPGWRAGSLISIAATLVLGALAVTAWRRRGSSRHTSERDQPAPREG